MNDVSLIGRLVRDPELKFSVNGSPFTTFTIAVNKKLYGKRKEKAINEGKPTANFINIVVFGKQAENCANYLFKGSLCSVSGEIETGSYIGQNNEKKHTFVIIAKSVEFISSNNKEKDQNLNLSSDGDNYPVEDNEIFQTVNEEDIPF